MPPLKKKKAAADKDVPIAEFYRATRSGRVRPEPARSTESVSGGNGHRTGATVNEDSQRTDTVHPEEPSGNDDSEEEASNHDNGEGSNPTGLEPPLATKKRGLSKGYEIMKRTGTGGKIDGIYVMENGQSFVGPNESLLKTELGVVTRLMAPIRKYYWSKLTEADKHPLFKKLEDEFDIDTVGQDARKIMEKRMKKRFINYKYAMHAHYLKDPEKARTDPPVDRNIEDWNLLCDHFESEKFRKRSEINKVNKSKQVYAHTSGAKSLDQRIYELEKKKKQKQQEQPTGEEQPTEMEDGETVEEEPLDMLLYAKRYQKADGSWVSEEPMKNYLEMQSLWIEAKAEGKPLSGREIVQTVLKKKLKYGPKENPRSAKEQQLQAELEAARAEAERKAKEFEEKIQSQEEQLKSQAEKIQLQEEKLQIQEERFETQEEVMNQMKAAQEKLQHQVLVIARQLPRK
ncbi:unnamed protein product [Linum trigynum]|uniref:Uncharacterized protein n=1 Tax=Linum trigynum TaxID=586398 RepID=A0AAV2F6G1_9ROSI